MPHFLFHLHEYGIVTVDEEGRDLPDIDAARREAEIAARSIICAELDVGDICLNCHIEIENRDTGERLIVAFRDTVRIVDE